MSTATPNKRKANLKEELSLKTLERLSMLSERVGHLLRSPLYVVKALVEDSAGGYDLEAQDFTDGLQAIARIEEVLNCLGDFSINLKTDREPVKLNQFFLSVISELPEVKVSDLSTKGIVGHVRTTAFSKAMFLISCYLKEFNPGYLTVTIANQSLVWDGPNGHQLPTGMFPCLSLIRRHHGLGSIYLLCADLLLDASGAACRVVVRRDGYASLLVHSCK